MRTSSTGTARTDRGVTSRSPSRMALPSVVRFSGGSGGDGELGAGSAARRGDSSCGLLGGRWLRVRGRGLRDAARPEHPDHGQGQGTRVAQQHDLGPGKPAVDPAAPLGARRSGRGLADRRSGRGSPARRWAPLRARSARPVSDAERRIAAGSHDRPEDLRRPGSLAVRDGGRTPGRSRRCAGVDSPAAFRFGSGSGCCIDCESTTLRSSKHESYVGSSAVGSPAGGEACAGVPWGFDRLRAMLPRSAPVWGLSGFGVGWGLLGILRFMVRNPQAPLRVGLDSDDASAQTLVHYLRF